VLLLWRLSPLTLVSASCQSVSPLACPPLVCQPLSAVSPLWSVSRCRLSAPSGLSAAVGCQPPLVCQPLSAVCPEVEVDSAGTGDDQRRRVEMALVPLAASAGRLERRPALGPPLRRCRLVGRCVAMSSLSVNTAAAAGEPTVRARAAEDAALERAAAGGAELGELVGACTGGLRLSGVSCQLLAGLVYALGQCPCRPLTARLTRCFCVIIF